MPRVRLFDSEGRVTGLMDGSIEQIQANTPPGGRWEPLHPGEVFGPQQYGPPAPSEPEQLSH